MGKRTQKLMLKDLAKKTLNLGYVGENDHTQITIDCSEVFWDYPNAVPVLNVQPPRGDKYPATQITKDGDDIIWTISDSDIIYAGSGRIQLKFTNNGEIVKSAVGSTKIDGSIETTGDAPAPLEDWMDRAEETAEQIAETAAATVLENYDELVDDVSSLKSAIVTKAEEDGYYEELTAGSAEQLISTEAVTNTTPYLYRKSGGSADVGNRETLEKIVGGTVGWNQLVQNGNFDDASNWHSYGVASLNVSDNEATITWTGSGNASFRQGISPSLIPTHKYIISADMKGNSTRQAFMQVGNVYKVFSVTDNYNSYVRIIEPSSLASGPSVFIGYITGESGDTLSMRKTNLIDLTAMFGPTIADYVYGLEQANAGAGVAWFRKLFPKDYYPYNPGELISVKPSSHDMVGFNLWDEEWEVGSYYSDGRDYPSTARIRTKHFNPIIPGATYYANTPYVIDIYFFDGNKNHIAPYVQKANVEFTAPAEARYIKFCTDASYGTTYKNDICINLSHSGSRNGEYEPYEKHSYPLADVELRGPLAIDADGKLVYSGDEYTPDGNVKRNYIRLNLGDYNYRVQSNKLAYTTEISSLLKKYPNFNVANIIMVGYDTISRNNAGYGETVSKKGCGVDNDGYFFIADPNMTWTTAEQVKAALTGMVLIAELATPTIEQVAPYTPVQVVDDWGTEEFVDTREVAIPVGHSTSYMANLRDKLQHLPSLAEEDGEYIVKQTGTKMELSKLSSSGLAQSIYESIESTPVASFADGADGQAMKAVNVAIEPVQDLHGYDAPWPAGGGKNLLPKPTGTSVTEAGIVWTVNDDGSIKVSGTATGRSLFYYTKNNNIIVNNVKAAYATGSLNGTQLGSGVLVDGVWKNFSTVGAISGSVEQVWFDVPSGATVNGVIYPMFLASSETDLSWSPYSNICPISGWTGAKVTRTGKNLLPMTAYKNFSYNPQIGTKFSPMSADHSYVDNGGGTFVCSATASWEQCGLLIPAPVAGTYYLSIQIDGAPTVSINRLNTEYVVVSNATYLANPLQASATIAKTEVVAEPGYILIYIASHGTEIKITNPICQYEEPITTYIPYSSNTYSITFPSEAGTVYGGTLDVVSGKLVADRVIATISDLSVNINFNVGTYTVMKRFFLKIPSNSGVSYNKLHGAIASFGVEGEAYYGSQRNNDLGSLKVNYAITGSGENLAIYDTDLSLTDTTFMEKYGSQQVCYPLASPIEYTLTPQEIKTLLGVNNIWSDAGNTAITYPADTKLYIDNKIAELQALILENNG